MKPVQPPTIQGTAHKEKEFLETEAIPLSDLEALVHGPISKINSLMKRMGVHWSSFYSYRGSCRRSYIGSCEGSWRGSCRTVKEYKYSRRV